MISTKLENFLRDIADFPKPGILFKDITPILKDARLCTEVIDEFVNRLELRVGAFYSDSC
jgi:adenine phosphoribosyltransferase